MCIVCNMDCQEAVRSDIPEVNKMRQDESPCRQTRISMHRHPVLHDLWLNSKSVILQIISGGKITDMAGRVWRNFRDVVGTLNR